MASGMDQTISRRQCLRALGLGALGAGVAAAQQSRRPNVLMIAVDDLNDWIGALGGHPQAVTPNMDRLAQRGVLFRRAYCQAPSCNPSRTSLMTGMRPSTSGVYQNNDVWRDAMPTAVTLPQHFQLHGYEVLGGGKIFHGPMNEAQSWDYYYNPPGFLRPQEASANGLNSGHFDWSPIQADDEDTADTMLAQWASDYLSKKRNRPFFLACGFYRPHLPWFAPQKYFEKFPESETVLPKVLAGDLDDVPKSAQQRSQRDHDNVTSSGQWRKAVAAYLACINYADANVGRVLDALDASPHADNTIIVLWTDHGWHLGEHTHWRKFTLWEESCRVAMIIAGAGVRGAGRACERTVELLDIYPTLADMAGLPPRPELEGRSLRPLLEDPGAMGQAGADLKRSGQRLGADRALALHPASGRRRALRSLARPAGVGQLGRRCGLRHGQGRARGAVAEVRCDQEGQAVERAERGGEAFGGAAARPASQARS